MADNFDRFEVVTFFSPLFSDGADNLQAAIIQGRAVEIHRLTREHAFIHPSTHRLHLDQLRDFFFFDRQRLTQLVRLRQGFDHACIQIAERFCRIARGRCHLVGNPVLFLLPIQQSNRLAPSRFERSLANGRRQPRSLPSGEYVRRAGRIGRSSSPVAEQFRQYGLTQRPDTFFREVLRIGIIQPALLLFHRLCIRRSGAG